jgi:hypothetical protein
MTRVVLASVTVVALAAIAAAAYARGFVPGTAGCVLRSVDEGAYVRGNEAVLRALPLPPALREAHANTWTHPIPATNKCLPFFENGPPYSAFVTTHVFLREAGEPPLGLDVRVLGRRWRRETIGAGPEMTFRKGPARLHVSMTDDGLLLSVDHRGYADHR